MFKILLVDDSEYMRGKIKGILAEGGYTEVYEAGNGVEACQRYEEIKPDLVLMDLVMPGMSGMEALEEICSIDENASVVMCSAMKQEPIIIDAMRLGAKDFIVKPFEDETLLQAVAAIAKEKDDLGA